ncbi:MAG: cold-shock protein, partial [Alphaproteobacteria bacterium]|nr:cold-shock protein [Alphaproteobacteria bacterium]
MPLQEGWVSVMAASGAPRGEGVSGLSQAPETNIRIIQVNGLVKWFDPGRGYGFIIPDNGMQDVLVHLSCLKRDGFEAPLEGARITCEAVERQKGYQCLRVLAVDHSTAIHPVERKSRAHTTVQPSCGWVKAKVKWFNRARGFGFL